MSQYQNSNVFILNMLYVAKNNLDTNLGPLFVIGLDGIPKLATQCSIHMRTTAVAFFSTYCCGLFGVSFCCDAEKPISLRSFEEGSKYAHINVLL